MSLLLLLRSSVTSPAPARVSAATAVLAPTVNAGCNAAAPGVTAATAVLSVSLPTADPWLLGVLSGATVGDGRMTGQLL